METGFISLAAIAIVAAAVPLAANRIPGEFVPIPVSLRLNPDTRHLRLSDCVTVAFYCTTALPLIVAVTDIAVAAGAMEPSTASIMVAAGAVSVFLMPLLASACKGSGGE